MKKEFDERCKLPEFDLFGGEYTLPPDDRLLLRLSVRLSPSQKKRFFAFCMNQDKLPSEVVREFILSMI